MDKSTRLTLTRQTRLYFPIGPETNKDQPMGENRWHACGEIRPWATYVTIDTSVSGIPDPLGGYLLDIRTMDRLLISACRNAEQRGAWPNGNQEDSWSGLQRFATQVWDQLNADYARWSTPVPSLRLAEMVWRFTPQLAITLRGEAEHLPQQHNDSTVDDMNSEHDNTAIHVEQRSVEMKPSVQVNLTMQYEFAAAHRLHCDHWTDAENRDVFGKCNHPSGHGHNYLLEVTVDWSAASSNHDSPTSAAYANPTAFINPIVQTHVLQRLDHRFLNLDVAEFQALNPTVENIAQVIFQWLDAAVPETIQLCAVKVYETAKTWAEVRRG